MNTTLLSTRYIDELINEVNSVEEFIENLMVVSVHTHFDRTKFIFSWPSNKHQHLIDEVESLYNQMNEDQKQIFYILMNWHSGCSLLCSQVYYKTPKQVEYIINFIKERILTDNLNETIQFKILKILNEPAKGFMFEYELDRYYNKVKLNQNKDLQLCSIQ